VGVGLGGRLRGRRLPRTIGDVVVDGGGEEAWLLRHDGHDPPESFEVVLAQVLAVEEHVPRGGLVEALYEREDGALAASAGADGRQRPSGARLEGEILEHLHLRSGRVGEVDVPELDVPSGSFGDGRGSVGLHLRLAVDGLEDGAHGAASPDEVGRQRERLGGAVGGDHEHHEDADGAREVGDRRA
jgi:hypothetical protein